jgi:hypothetical protein
MKHTILAACGALAVAGTMTLSAQTPTPAPRPPSPTPAPSTPTMSNPRSDEKTVTVTGCLKTWDSSMGQAPAAATATAGAKYVLTNVEAEGASPGATREGATETSGSSVESQYALTADASVKLAAHLNHKVRVTGKASRMTDHSATGASRPMDPAAKPGDPPRTGMDKAHKNAMWSTLNVTSLTMISATCPAQSR